MTHSEPARSDKPLRDSTRAWANHLCLWRLCGKSACLRGRACRGNVNDCFPRTFPLLSEDVRCWFVGVGEAQKERLTFDEAMEWLDSTPAGEALHAWREAVAASLVPRPQVKPDPEWTDR